MFWPMPASASANTARPARCATEWPARINYNKWADIRVNMDTLCENGTPDTHVELFGRSFKYPFFAGPVGAVNLHYSDVYTDMTYNDVLVRACAESGIAAFTGDGTNPDVMTMATKAIGNADGCGVPTIKPWDMDTIREKFALVQESEPFAIAMDIDAAGLPFLQGLTPPAGSKSVEELKQIVSWAQRPFILKGIILEADCLLRSLDLPSVLSWKPSSS